MRITTPNPKAVLLFTYVKLVKLLLRLYTG
jgi:hypothetical protein